jgi:hypothetical protein
MPKRVLTAVLVFVLVGLAVFGGAQLLGRNTKDPAPVPAATDVLSRYAQGIGGVNAGDRLGFSSLFPDQPIDSSSALKDPSGGSIPTDSVSSRVGQTTFEVTRIAFPKSVDVSSSQLVLRKAADGAASARPGGTLVSHDELTVGADPATDFLVSYANGSYRQGRAVLHGRTLYLVRVDSKSQDPAGFDRFVDSFEIL